MEGVLGLDQFTGDGSRSADVERNVKVGGMPNSKIPSIFDHVVRNSSTIEPYYHKKGGGE